MQNFPMKCGPWIVHMATIAEAFLGGGNHIAILLAHEKHPSKTKWLGIHFYDKDRAVQQVMKELHLDALTAFDLVTSAIAEQQTFKTQARTFIPAGQPA